jgi:hypothetical protein
MSESNHPAPHDPIRDAYRDGRRFGLATGALALSIVAFINLLGMEKSVLAIVLAILAMQGAEPAAAAYRRARTAIVIAAVHVVTIVAFLVLFHDKMIELVHALHKLS